MDWLEEALCEGMDTEWFFDEYLKNDEIAAKVDKLCAECPVQTQCYNFGKELKSTGIWGGVWLQMGKAEKNLERVKENW